MDPRDHILFPVAALVSMEKLILWTKDEYVHRRYDLDEIEFDEYGQYIYDNGKNNQRLLLKTLCSEAIQTVTFYGFVFTKY